MALKNATAKATIWSLLDTYTGFALKFIFAIAITRILTPHDYGLVAYMGLFLGVAIWLSDWGFGTSLIQKKNVTNIDFSTGYLFNIVISLFFFFLYFFSASYIADYFNEPALEKIMRITSINLIINGLCYIHNIKLIKAIQFKKLAIVNLTTSIISGIIGFVMALMGCNYWALIIQTLSGNILRMLGIWYIFKWVPEFKFSWTSFKEQFKFGSKVFVQGLLENIFKEIHSLVIGRTYKTEALGNYSRGQKFYDLFIIQTGVSFNKVLYPSMVNKTDEIEAHKIMYIKTYGLLFFFVAPLSLYLFLLSEPIVRILLTDKWIGAVPYMHLYFIAGFIFLLAFFNSTTILSANKPKLFLTMDILQKLFIGIALIITFNKGISTIIIGWLLAYYFYFIIYEVIMYNNGFFSIEKYYKMFHVIICILPSILIYYVSANLISSYFWLLFVNTIFQAGIYFLLMKFFGFTIYKEFLLLAIPFFPKIFLKKNSAD